MHPTFPESLKQDNRRKWSALQAAATDAGIQVPEDADCVADIQTVFALSDFIAKNCIRQPALLAELVESGDLEWPYEPDEHPRRVESALASATGESELSIALRRLRKREMVRIAWRDLSGRADLSTTMAELSAFADACIDGALSRLHRWLEALYGRPLSPEGRPQELVVIGMGKLGARELNFSSDVDLIFAFPETGETDGKKSIPNADFFLRLGRKLIKALGENTAEGFVFRVDMDLRPFGGNGPLVMSFDAVESYYAEQGREWERYAWIKGRPAAGDIPAGERLLARLNPFIYRRYLDYGVFESLRQMKAGIDREVRRRELQDDIKLGPGGIREIEFFGQVFQLIRGGVSRRLQARPIQTILHRLTKEGIIEGSVRNELQAAYIFLRLTENRLQAFGDAQTHKLPPDESGRQRLAAAMGFDDYDGFAQALKHHMSVVRGHFGALLEPGGDGPEGEEKDRRESDLERLWQSPDDAEGALEILSDAGYEDPAEALNLIRHLRDSTATAALSREGRERLDRLVPRILKAAGTVDLSTLALSRILELIRTVQQRTSYLALLLENPSALSHLVRFATTSAWILTFITRHPVLLDELLDTRTLYVPPDRAALETEIRERLDPIPPDDLEYQMDALRIFKQVNVLRVAAADVTDALPLMRVSDHLSDIAETILGQVLAISSRHLKKKHGEPVCSLPEGEICREGFAVIAYGKLGGLELGYGSDLDMVFLHAGASEPTQGGDRPTDSAYFFARLGQRIIHMLTARTSAGALYEADMRLRPSGASGVLVSHMDAFGRYQENEAWTWEQQALIRGRPVSGDPAIARRFAAIRRRILARSRDEGQLRRSVADMRDRLRKDNRNKGNARGFDLKHGDGGMVDIEFLVQYLVLRHAHRHEELVRWTDNVRLIGALARCGILDDVTAYFLRKAYLTYRIVGHRLDLKEQPPIVSDDRFRILRRMVRRNWDRFLGP